MSTISVSDFLADATGRCFVDVVNADPGLFDRIVDFCGDPGRRQRMLDAVGEGRPALAGVVTELEQQPWFEAHMTAMPETRRLRQAIGVLVKVIVQDHGLRTTGRRGQLPGSRWFGSAEMYLPHSIS